MGWLNNLEMKIRKMVYPYLQVSAKQYKLLEKIAGRGKLIVEIGSYQGGTTMRLSKKNRIIAIDPFIGGWDEKDLTSKNIEKQNRQIIATFKNNIKENKWSLRNSRQVVWLREKSEDVLKRWAVEIDGLFIDGDHTYEGVKRDSKWIKHVKKGGFIAFHDVSELFPPVREFVKKEIVPNYEFIAKRGSLWIFRK